MQTTQSDCAEKLTSDPTTVNLMAAGECKPFCLALTTDAMAMGPAAWYMTEGACEAACMLAKDQLNTINAITFCQNLK